MIFQQQTSSGLNRSAATNASFSVAGGDRESWTLNIAQQSLMHSVISLWP